MSGSPAGSDFLPLPRSTVPSPVIRIFCPLRTTQPEFVQPLLVLSAVTFMSQAMGCIAPGFEFCFGGSTRPGCDPVALVFITGACCWLLMTGGFWLTVWVLRLLSVTT